MKCRFNLVKEIIEQTFINITLKQKKEFLVFLKKELGELEEDIKER